MFGEIVMTPDWVRLPKPSIELSEVSSTEEKGVKIHVYASPHDIPRAVRGYPDPATGRIVIEFKYIDDEPQITRQEGPHASIRLGEFSRRIFAIELDPRHFKGANIHLELTAMVRSAVGKLDETSENASVRKNHSLALGVIEQQEGNFLQFA